MKLQNIFIRWGLNEKTDFFSPGFCDFFGIGGAIAYNINNINRQNEATSFTEQLNAVVKNTKAGRKLKTGLL